MKNPTFEFYKIPVLLCLLLSALVSTYNLKAAVPIKVSQPVDTSGLTFEPLQPGFPPAELAESEAQQKTGNRSTRSQQPSRLLTASHQVSLPNLFFQGLLGGSVALLMPCIYPIFPLTVSFFTKKAGSAKSIRDAKVYGLSIIFIYVGLGMLITIAFGSDALNALSTSGLFNIAFQNLEVGSIA